MDWRLTASKNGQDEWVGFLHGDEFTAEQLEEVETVLAGLGAPSNVIGAMKAEMLSSCTDGNRVVQEGSVTVNDGAFGLDLTRAPH